MKKTLFVLFMICSFAAQAGVAVIANPSVGDGATEKDIKKVFMGKKSELAGSSVTPVDQKEGSAVRNAFYDHLIGLSSDDVKAYRIEMLFTGKATPPKEVADDAAVKLFVSSTPGAIGYIDESKVDASVKVLLKK